MKDYIDCYHGEKVGVGLILASKIYHKAAEKMRGEAFTVKESMPVEEELIRVNFTKLGMYESIIEENTPNLLEEVDSQKLLERKDEIAAVIDEIPSAGELTDMLKEVNGVRTLENLSFDESFQEKTARLSPYVRARITFMRLLKFYSFYEEVING